MLTLNSTNFYNLKENQILYLVRYSNANYPDFIVVKFKKMATGKKNIEYIEYINEKDVVKRITNKKASYRLYSDINEMMRNLYGCFDKRGIEIISEYKTLMLQSQDERPELWI